MCFRSKALSGGTNWTFPFLGFHCIYIQMEHLSQIQGDLKSGSYQNSFGHCVYISEKEQIPPRKHIAVRKHKMWSLNTTGFFQEQQSRHSPNPSFKTELRGVPEGSTRSRLFLIYRLCSFRTLRTLGCPHAHSTSSLCHEHLHSHGWISVQDQVFAHQGCGTSCCVSAPWYPRAATLPLKKVLWK